MSQPLVTFVVPTRNRASLLERTLRSIAGQHAHSGNTEILVIDNRSTDDTAQRVETLRRSLNINLIHHIMTENGGPARSRNKGAELARGRYLAFVDSDVELLPDWLDNILRPLETDPQIGMVAGKLLFASDPSVVHCLGGELSRIGLGWDAYQGQPCNTVDTPVHKLWAPSASFAIRTELFRSLGGFDDQFFYGYEDSDFGWRLNLAGWICYCTPHALALHATTARIDDSVRKVSDEIVYHYSKNRIRSILKNCGPAWLFLYLPFSLAYSVVDSLARSPRSARIQALLWNVTNLADTLRMRRAVQRQRRVRDREIAHLFAAQWFPPQTLNARMRDNSHLHGLRSAAKGIGA